MLKFYNFTYFALLMHKMTGNDMKVFKINLKKV